MILVILVIFPISGNNGKYIKIYYIEKKKKFSAKPFLGYCPIYIVKKKKKNLYCKKGKCIAREGLKHKLIVL